MAIHGSVEAASLRILISSSLVKGCKILLMVSRLESSLSSSSDSDSDSSSSSDPESPDSVSDEELSSSSS